MAADEIVVIASCNIDLISYVGRIPKIGETLIGNRFQMGFGGKGANLTVACSRLGSKCAIIAKLGNDIFGNNYVDSFKKSNINTQHVFRTDLAATGVAPIAVDENGANLLLSADDVKSCEQLIRSSKIVVSNLEISYETVLSGLRLAKAHNALSNYKPELFECVDYIILNEVEIEQLLNQSGDNTESFQPDNIDDVKRACARLLDKHARLACAIVTLGENGVVYSDRSHGNKPAHVSIEKVKVVDSTGAGDAFVGAFVHYFNKFGREEIYNVIRLAADYATLTVQFPGTQSSYLSIDDLEARFKI